ncbi:laminin subunit alpha-1 isoform X2 [Amphiprion ocellaris]|uniref:laminin subunit alpha-1 isoform X2 n=1 Tax=Amphiprion ocellaris TaxID=80972 RepID=UPI0024116FDF|nr:laminin subunit alpha-1 isoform X2 [Amphiprion ocellaris]
MKLLLLLILMQRAAAQQRGLFPAILNLASNAVISSNATCGDPQPEIYCKLVEHVPGRTIKNPHCAKCDANSVLSKERHPIAKAIDGTNQWWQSPSIKNGRQFHWVTITLDLKQVFQVAYIIIKAANSPRPGNWILERSLDGVSFDPWQFYAISDSECLTRYNMTPRLGPPTYQSDTEVICTSYYSRLNPLEHGEIHTSLINGRPGADDLTSDLLNFTSARYIRLRLQRIRTLNADLMTLSDRDPRDIDPIVTRRYYYSIKDVSVGGMCICYGHAQSCPLDPVTQKLQCLCEHNTCGESCNECCRGYHQQPWQPGTISEGNTCEECNCHNKSLECFFNQTVSDLSLSLNSDGVRRGGGVCIDCQKNTAGINCETCRDGYYRPAEVSPFSDSPCSECRCDLRGSKSLVCSRDDTQPGVSAGQCVCQEGFAGRRCDRCAFGFRDFPQCVRCDCNLSGSTNTDPCSPCTCKVNVMGDNCDLCKPGFYNLQENNPLGCTDCFCFGVSDVCESSAWSTVQVVHTDARLRPFHSLHNHLVLHDNDLTVPSNASSGSSHQQVLQWAAPDSFLGNKLVSYGGFLNYSVFYDIPLDNEDRSLPAHCDVVIEGTGQSLRLSPPLLLFLSPLAERPVAVAMVPQRFMDHQTGVPVTRDDLLSVLAGVTALMVRVHLNSSADGPIRLHTVSLDAADSGSVSGVPAVAVENCECPWGYNGTSCEVCSPGFYRVDGVMFGGNCMLCECNDHATECDANGECVGCTHNTTGPHCDKCVPGFYGDATEGTAHDCRLCPCPLTDLSNRFSPTCVLDASGQVSCDQCQDGYTGNTCERCASGFYGNPQVVGGTCIRCQCNGNVNVSEPGHCDTVTGECLHCLGNTAGSHCEVCRPGCYGDAVHNKDCQECGCDVSGAISGLCDVTSGQCSCRENVTGRTCGRCQLGFFGLQSGRGCHPCGCSQLGSLSESCDEEGRCQCVEGVAGDRCDRCSRGYYGFHGSGCKACTCDHTGGNCDPESGECICPAHTEGHTCDRCETGHWGHEPTTGCKPCSCSAAGSSAPQCDLTNGQCLCREGFSGRSCDRCAPGYYGYPACSACGCDLAGTNQMLCNATLGVCDCQHTGECVCKAGVSGRHCEECVSGRLGLSAENPDGCSQCFCSGLSSDCEEQGGLTRVPVTLSGSPALLSLVSQSNLQGVVSGVYQQGGDMLLDTRQLNSSGLSGPLYWRLPAQFEGDQLLSYGGLLSYSITFYAEDGSGLSNQEPQVLMRGGALRKLVIYTDVVAPGNGVRTQHDIRLTEHQWKYFNSVSLTAVSHSDFLSVLSNVQYVIIKASYGTRLQQSRIANITMETAVEAELGEESEGVHGGVARLIESCVCPPGYSGLSCQECAAGYFRQHQSELSPHSQRSIFVHPCVPCRCNNHSESCNTETGDCQDCQHHTSGRSCELCAPGYHGNVSGSIGDCSLCACPLHDNSFSPTCVSEGAFGDFRCTSCETGYEGRYCERCSVGYYGNPSVSGGVCQHCSCSRQGSLHPRCDALTGQCECRPGNTGRSCDQCDNKHVLQGAECVSCDDDCTGVLLDDLTKLNHLHVSVNLSGVAMVTYWQLVSLHNQSRDLQMRLSENSSITAHLSRAEDNLRHLTSDLSALLQQVTRLSDDLLEVGVSTNNSFSQGALLLESIGSLQDNIQVLQREAGHLNQTVEDELDSANQTRLLEEVASLLETVRAVNLTAAMARANQELSLSESLIQSLQQNLLSSRVALDNWLHPLSTAMTVTMATLNHAETHLNSAAQQNTETHTLLHQYESVHQNLSAVCLSVDGLMEDIQLHLEDAISLTEDLTNSSAVEVLDSQLDQWRPLLRRQVDGLVVGLKQMDALESVYRAENHAHLLQSHAHSLHSSLAAVCNTSQNGSQLAQLDGDITEQVDSAQLMAWTALESASHAVNMSVQSEQVLADEGGAKLNLSCAVLEESRGIGAAAKDLQVKVSMVTSRVRLVRDGVDNSNLLLRQPIGELHTLSTGWSVKLQRAQVQTAALQSGLRGALQQLQTLRQQLHDSSSVVENTNATMRETNQLVAHTHSAANDAQRKIEEAEHRTRRLMDRIKPLSILGETLDRNLSDIRELIDQARRQAASIKVAVQADRECVRSYRPQIESSNFNTLSLILKTSRPDNLLFYLGSNATVDFLAVEMHAGKVSLLWDVGAGVSRLDFSGLDITNNRWTRINATRFGARAALSVHQLDSESPPLPTVTATSPGSSRVLDIDRNTVIHVGGLGAHTQSPAALRSSSFQGCLGEAALNENNIGLWNYDSREGQCGGCFSSPQAEETSFHFDGSGFSLVHKSLRATSTSIVLLFKALSPGGLLLYLASNNTRDFLSMELVGGRVRLTFDLGSGALILTSSRKYNTGVWFKITLQRNRRKAYLSIMAADQPSEKEVLEAESPGMASDLNRSDLDPIYIGGLPASRPIRRQVVSRSYVGCIRNVEIARSNFDLLRDAFGVRKGCVLKAVRSVSLLARGFVQIAPPSFGQELELLFSFSSNNQSGVLLATFSDDRAHRQHFFSVHLGSGVLEAELGEVGGASCRVTVMKPDGGSFSDGKKHSVIVTINRMSLSMQVDEDHQKSVSLLQGGFSRQSPASFFIGGLPSGKESRLPIRLQHLSRRFRGCIQHLVVGGALVDLSGAMRYEGAELNSCLLEERPGGAVLPDDQDVEPTPDPTHLSVAPPTHLSALTAGALTCSSEIEPALMTSAAQFGSSPHSHMTFIIDPASVRKRLLLRLSVRSWALDGIVLLLSDSKQMDFVVLRLNGGRVMMSADLGKGPASITSSVAVNDGKWHIVSVEVSRRLVSVSVDGLSPESVPVKGNQLDVDNRLYLGGFPNTATSRRINVSSSFPGCVRSASLNGASLDLSQPTSQSDVAACFTKDQPGSYFNGSGYAKLIHDGYKVGSDMSVSLEFRTSQSEGVFVGISSAKVDAVGLEMIDGQVVFNVNNGAGRVSVRSIGQMLCDGRWHRLLARKTKHSLSLSVDGRSYTAPNPYPQSTSAETNNPVYLGGFPVGVKQNCLSISSSFRGCLRNLQLAKSHLSAALYVSSAHFLVGVTPNSCPVA